jgi:hypothetical protein
VRARTGSSTVGAREAAIDSSRTLPAARGSHLATAAAVLGGVALHAVFIERAMFRAETARIAVIWAGAIPYFSRRPAIDLLGKSDPVIAALRPRLGFRLPPRDIERIGALGYEKVAQYYVRRGAPVDPRPLRAPWR